MVNWNKDRNRQLKKRARAEEFEHKQKERAPRPDRRIRPRMSKAVLRAVGEEAVRQFKRDQRERSGSGR
jgi:hypothetical protein